MRILTVVTLLCAIAGPACAQDKGVIQDIQTKLAKAILAGDGIAAADLYSADAILLPPGVPAVAGREAIQAFWAKRGPTLAELTLTTVSVTPLGPEFAREIGTLAGKPSGSDAKPFTGKYLIIYQKSGDRWLATTDAWNRD